MHAGHHAFTRMTSDLVMKQSNPMHTTRKPPRKPLLPPRKPVYVYRWDRIFTGIATLLVLAGVVYGVAWWFASAPKEAPDRAEIPPKANVGMEVQLPGGDADPIELAGEDTPRTFSHAESETMPVPVAGKTEPSAGMASAAIPLAEDSVSTQDGPEQRIEGRLMETQAPSAETAKSADVTIAAEGAEEMVAYTIDPEDPEPAIVVQSSEASRDRLSEDAPAEPQAGTSEDMPLHGPGEGPDSTDKTLGTDTPTNSFRLKERKVLDPAVKRFMLTKSVAKREPLGELNDIRFDARGSAVVWAYSEVVDRRGSRFDYVWLQDGNPVAKVPVTVRGNRWRSYSNKVINQSMRGAWRVELRDGEGRLMASADFFLE